MPAWLPLVAALAGCSLTGTRPDSCELNSDCQAAFGWGQVCGDSGLCEPVTPPARCGSTVPDDLFQNRELYGDLVVLGSLYDDVAFPLEVLAISLAFEQVNDNGGFDGRDFGLVRCTSVEDSSLDSLSQEEANVEAALFLADRVGVPSIVGPATSDRTEDAFVAVEPFGTLVISPSATSPALTSLDGLEHSDAEPGLLWRTAPPDSLQGVVIAADMEERGVDRVAVIYQVGAYGEGLSEAFQLSFSGEVDLVPFESSTERTDAVTEVGDRQGIDEVLFISSEKADIVAFFNAAAAVSGYGDLGIFLSDGAFDTAILEEASGASELFRNVRGTRPAVPTGDVSEVYEAFVASFAAEFGEDAESSGFTAYAFDAAWLTVYGAAWSWYHEGAFTGLGSARGLRQVSGGPDFYIRGSNWQDIRANFKEGNSVDLIGASGELDFDPVTGETSAPYDIWVINKAGTGFVVIETVEP